MNRIDRLFGILLLLQARRKLRAEDVAEVYEITPRTVYRDMAALMELGIPILAQAGEGYSLMEGYFLPPLVFTSEEAQAVLLGIKMLEASGNHQSACQSARTKLHAALPPRLIRQVDPLVQVIEFYSEKRRFNLKDSRLLSLQQALQEQRVIHLSYQGWNEDHVQERTVEPIRLLFNNGIWYLMAFCRLRQAQRSFRLERIEKLRLLNERFTPRASAEEALAPPISVSLHVPTTSIRHVQERQHYALVGQETQTDGIVFHYRVHSLSEIQAWVLGWGTELTVLQPSELRQAIRQEAEKWLLRY